MAVLFVAGYCGLGRWTEPARAREWLLPLDTSIPFVPAMIWIYLWIFPAVLSPLFVVDCRRLFRRTATAYAVVMLLSFVCFWAYPVTSIHLRAGAEALAHQSPTTWAVRTVYALDPPFNLWPSLHVSLVTVAAFSTWKLARGYGVWMFAGVFLLALSVCTVKQHFVYDALSGLVLGAAACATFLASPTPSVLQSRGGAGAHRMFTAAFYVACLLAYACS